MNGIAPTVSILGNVEICQEASTVIYGTSNNDYSWSDGSIADTLLISSSGDYYLSSTNSCGTDTAFFSITDLGVGPTGILTGDQYLCNSDDSVALYTAGGDSYQWSNGDNTANSYFGVISDAYVLVYNQCGQDSIPFSIADESVTAQFSPSVSSGLAPINIDFINNSTSGTSAT